MQPYLTVNDLAQILQFSTKTIYNRRHSGKPLPPCIVVGGKLRFRPQDVEAWLAAMAGQGGALLEAGNEIPVRVPGRKRGRPTKAEQLRRARAEVSH